MRRLFQKAMIWLGVRCWHLARIRSINCCSDDAVIAVYIVTDSPTADQSVPVLLLGATATFCAATGVPLPDVSALQPAEATVH